MITPQVVNEITNVVTEKKLSLFRRYFVEITLIVLALVVSYLFIALNGLQNKFLEFVITNNATQNTVINTSNEVIKDNTRVIQQNNELTQRRIQQMDQNKNPNP